jgi:hypothetical protein
LIFANLNAATLNAAGSFGNLETAKAAKDAAATAQWKLQPRVQSRLSHKKTKWSDAN